MLVIRGARLFDGLTASAGRPAVLVEDGRIVDVDLSGAPPPAHATVVDLGAVTLLPGLVDAHVHLAFDPTRDLVTAMRRDDDPTLLERMRGNARRALYGPALLKVSPAANWGDRVVLAGAVGRSSQRS